MCYVKLLYQYGGWKKNCSSTISSQLKVRSSYIRAIGANEIKLYNKTISSYARAIWSKRRIKPRLSHI